MARKKLHIRLRKGALHRELGIPEGEKIPASRIAAAARSSNPVLKKRAIFAQNASNWGR